MGCDINDGRCQFLVYLFVCSFFLFSENREDYSPQRCVLSTAIEHNNLELIKYLLKKKCKITEGVLKDALFFGSGTALQLVVEYDNEVLNMIKTKKLTKYAVQNTQHPYSLLKVMKVKCFLNLWHFA